MKITQKKSMLYKINSGIVGNLVYIKTKDGVSIARARYVDVRETKKMETWRQKYRLIDYAWGQLTIEEKNQWRKKKWKKGWSNYAHFMHVKLMNAAL